jgi:hypothetical protein
MQNPGDDLFSRKAALSVSSALESLTSVFGMGTGVASPLESPGFMHLVDDGSDGRRNSNAGASRSRITSCLENPISPGTLTLGQVLD